MITLAMLAFEGGGGGRQDGGFGGADFFRYI